MIDFGRASRLERLYRAPDLTQLRRRLSETLADCGFWGVCERRNAAQVTDDYFDLSRYIWDNYASRVGGRRTELLNALLQANRAQGVAEENRRMRWVGEQIRPYVILHGAAVRFAAHQERCRLVEDFGLRSVDHLNLPLSKGQTGHHLIWAAAECESALKNAPEAIALLSAYGHMSQLLANHGRDRAGGQSDPLQGPGAEGSIVLKEKEREVLRWAAAGKTHRDIATITGLSPRAVRFHIEAARDRYGFATTQQAIVRAALDYGFDPLG